MTRFGPPLGKGGDGGKMVCEADELLGLNRRRGTRRKCRVVSVGLRRDTRFETQLLRAAPHCEVDGYDGSLSARDIDALPKAMRHWPQHFTEESHVEWLAAQREGDPRMPQHVALLKMDCESCEYKALSAWLEHVCTEQVIVEVHRSGLGSASGPLSRSDPHRSVIGVHRLMLRLHERHGFRIVFVEPNPSLPLVGTEYTLVRNRSCV
jgi:hypothetical protein